LTIGNVVCGFLTRYFLSSKSELTCRDRVWYIFKEEYLKNDKGESERERKGKREEKTRKGLFALSPSEK
jgi:hypothetical protein